MSLFKILKDASNNALALSKLALGDAVNGTIDGIAAYSFIDSSGNAIMPQLDSLGRIAVTFDAGTPKRETGLLAAGSQTKDVRTQVIEIDLVVAKTYVCPNAQVDCFRASLFEMVYVDDAGGTPVETVLGYALVGAGNVKADIELTKDEFSTVGGTGDQKLRIYHTPLDKESDAYASMVAVEA